MKSSSICRVVAGSICVALIACAAPFADAQCPTPSGIPVVAYSPVVASQPVTPTLVAQPTVTFEEYRGWYPGKWIDRWRLNRFGYTAPPPTTFAAATPVVQTAGFTPTTTFSPVTTLSPVTTTAMFAPSAPHVTAYAPLGQRSLRQQVVLSPVVSSAPVVTSAIAACDPCAVACPTCPSPVGQASFIDPSCPTCAPATSSPVYPSPPSVYPSNGGISNGTITPRPELTPEEADRLRTQYPPQNGTTNGNGAPSNGNGNGNHYIDPGPATDDFQDNSSYLEPPQLFNPQDRTANRGPTVDVWHAVHRQPVTTREASHTSVQRSQAEIDADGWHAVPSGR